MGLRHKPCHAHRPRPLSFRVVLLLEAGLTCQRADEVVQRDMSDCAKSDPIDWRTRSNTSCLGMGIRR